MSEIGGEIVRKSERGEREGRETGIFPHRVSISFLCVSDKSFKRKKKNNNSFRMTSEI